MIYQKGKFWKVIGSSKKYKTEEEAYASIEEGHNNGQDNTGIVAESTDRWVYEPDTDRTYSSPDSDS